MGLITNTNSLVHLGTNQQVTVQYKAIGGDDTSQIGYSTYIGMHLASNEAADCFYISNPLFETIGKNSTTKLDWDGAYDRIGTLAQKIACNFRLTAYVVLGV